MADTIAKIDPNATITFENQRRITPASVSREFKCKECSIAKYCTKPTNVDGKVIAGNGMRDETSRYFYADHGNCHPQIEGHPVER